MKRSAGKMFVRGFLKSFFIVMILLGAGALGYQLTMHFFEVPLAETAAVPEKEVTQQKNAEISVDDISKNLIYCYDEDTNHIDKIVLEIYDPKKQQLTYITIPMRTQLTMSDDLYRRMIVVQPAIPQVMQLSAMTSYLDSSTVFEYGETMLEDLLQINLSYYTVIPKATYDTIFKEEFIKSADGNKITLPVEAFTKDYAKFLKTLDSNKKITNYIEEIYPTLRTNLSLTDKLNYVESYGQTPFDNVDFQLIKGNDFNSAYMVDHIQAEQQLADLIQ